MNGGGKGVGRNVRMVSSLQPCIHPKKLEASQSGVGTEAYFTVLLTSHQHAEDDGLVKVVNR